MSATQTSHSGRVKLLLDFLNNLLLETMLMACQLGLEDSSATHQWQVFPKYISYMAYGVSSLGFKHQEDREGGIQFLLLFFIRV